MNQSKIELTQNACADMSHAPALLLYQLTVITASHKINKLCKKNLMSIFFHSTVKDNYSNDFWRLRKKDQQLGGKRMNLYLKTISVNQTKTRSCTLYDMLKRFSCH